MPGRPPTCRLRIGSQLSPDSIHEDLDWAREAVGPFAWRSKVIVDRSEPVVLLLRLIDEPKMI
jgi:hypothetical protein